MTTIENLPGWVVIAVGIASLIQIVASLVMIGLGILLIVLVKGTSTQLIETATEVKKIVQEDVRREIMPQVAGTMKNVRHISDDARVTSHNVTGTINRVSHVIGAIATRFESPVIRAVGLLTGLAAGARAVKASRGREVEVEVKRKRRGFFGR